jgi:hypothetical protein
MYFKIKGTIRDIETIATGHGIKNFIGKKQEKQEKTEKTENRKNRDTYYLKQYLTIQSLPCRISTWQE